MIDSHCHFDFPCFDVDRQQILVNCQKKNIHTILIPGTQASAWERQISLCNDTPQLAFALGLHPYFLAHFQSEHISQLGDLLLANKHQVLAVGEIGLDFAIPVDNALQQEVFEQQLLLAEAHRLPVILHHRRSHNQIIRTLKRLPVSRGGVVHAFSGSLYEAQTYIEMGFKLGIGGIITYPRAQKTREVSGQVPLSCLLLETDAPDMPPMGLQGQRNTPENLGLILDTLQELREEPIELVKQVCEQNYYDLFAGL
jgi:TatD DNase family protein